MRKTLLLLMFCITLGSAHAQTNETAETTQTQSGENITLHRVLMGETVVLLSKKYKMTPQDIYEYNPGASEGISQGMTLKIPLHRQVDLSAPKPQKQVVVANNNAASVTPKPEAVLLQPKVAQTGDTAITPEPVVAQTTVQVPKPVTTTLTTEQQATETITHTVQHGETLYLLSQKYGVSVNDIKQQNDDVKKRGLHVGQVLTIQQVSSPEGYTAHQVQQGETLYSLSRKYNVSVGQINDANKKALKKGLRAGQTLQIPVAGQ